MDAPCVAALRRAGALLVGKSSLHELGIGMTGINTRLGSPRNPYDRRLCAGGSSSGSAAAVSSGLCAFALGMDGGGSLRVPAALCGVVGLKPTVGRTSRQGCADSAFSIMSIGPITASVGDALLVQAVISNAGTEQHLHRPGATAVLRSLHDTTPGSGSSGRPLEGCRAGLFLPWVQAAASPEVLLAFRLALKHLSHLGCQVVDVEIPDLELVRAAQMVSVGCEIAQAYKSAYFDVRRRGQMNLDTRLTFANTTRFLATDFLQAQRIRTRLMSHLRELLQGVNFLISPTVGVTAPPISQAEEAGGVSDMSLTEKLMYFTIPVNMSGLPGLSLPIGQDSAGLPIGLQMVGRPWCEADLLFAASALESEVRRKTRPPEGYLDILFGNVCHL